LSNLSHGLLAHVVKSPNAYHGRFNPGDGIGMGYEDLKAIEAFKFLESIVDGVQHAPSFADALKLANVQTAMIRSWNSGTWESIPDLNPSQQP
jgi:hypothetical protein